MERINRGIKLSNYGLDDKNIRDIKNLPLIIELGKKIYRENSEYGVWDSYGYKHHIHSKSLKECLDILKPLGDRMLDESQNISIDEMLNSINEIKKERKPFENTKEINKNSVFVVHGRDEVNRKAMFKFLKAIGLDPIEWEEAVIMTGKPNPHIDEILIEAYNNAQAILVLFTPDDEAKLKPEFQREEDPDFEKRLTGQARPNVLFEAGMAYGRDPDRTVMIQIGQVRKFSDISGRHLLHFDGSSEARESLVNRLTLAGCLVNKDGINLLKEGAFNIKFTMESTPEKIRLNNEKEKVQQLFDELSRLWIRLYKSKAGTAMLFARTIRDSLEMQKYFGIYIKESAPPGKDFDDLPIYFIDKRFRLIPNSANLTWDIDKNNKYEFMLKKESHPDEIKDHLTKFFKKLIRFVQDEFKMNLEFSGEISI
ncbi:hypothetical protein LCGC14_1792920 [marine sediment metagenome]|uniref:CD-NTase-associated protein 12/Pycsar effector protein TIR domain-containing protein n=1 Tax=marine sediment metagenome TaxID=412755 RepID=A0A0F9JRI1_9ZZZZ